MHLLSKDVRFEHESAKLALGGLWCPQTCYAQRRNEDKWCLVQEPTLAPPYLNLRSYGSKFTVLKEVFVTLLESFGAPRSH